MNLWFLCFWFAATSCSFLRKPNIIKFRKEKCCVWLLKQSYYLVYWTTIDHNLIKESDILACNSDDLLFFTKSSEINFFVLFFFINFLNDYGKCWTRTFFCNLFCFILSVVSILFTLISAGISHLLKRGCWTSCNCSSSLQIPWHNKWNRPGYMGPI